MEHCEDLSDAGPTDGPHWIKHLPLNIGSEVVAGDGSAPRSRSRHLEHRDPGRRQARCGGYVVSKHRSSGFFETELDDLLRRLGVRYLLVTGCTTGVCVESTVRDALFRD
jgi:ureidoacrylate peracid hydrolase